MADNHRFPSEVDASMAETTMFSFLRDIDMFTGGTKFFNLDNNWWKYGDILLFLRSA